MKYSIIKATLFAFVSIGIVIPGIGQKAFKKIRTTDQKIEVNGYEHTPLYSTSSLDETDKQSLSFNPIQLANIIAKGNPLKAIAYKQQKPSLLEGRIPAKNLNLKQQINTYLKFASPHLKINQADEVFYVKEEWTDVLNQNHVKMNQSYKGVDVYGAEIILHGDYNGIFSLNGNYYTDKELKGCEVDFNLTEAEVVDLIKKTLKNYQDNFLSAKALSIFNKLVQWQIEPVVFKADHEFVSAYYVEVYANLAEHFSFFVDANSGDILRSYSNICSIDHKGACKHKHGNMPPDGPATTTAIDLLGQSRTINTWESSNNFYMADGSREMFQTGSSMPNDGLGIILSIDAFNTAPQNSNFSYDHFVSSNNSWSGVPEAVSAHYNGGQAYNYFRNVHNRNSISGDGQNIYSFVNVAGEDGSSMGNAFWNGQAIFYGNGDSAFKPLGRALDVAGHEMTHGVIQSTANLDYFSESGALNESFADVFGAMMDRDDWLIGEEVVKTSVFSSGALRNMQDPHNGQNFQDFARGWQPKHVNEQFLGSEDNGGVHLNSGIPNHAYYLFASNSSVGKSKAEKVYYRALTTYLTRSSNFEDMRIAVVKSAQDLYDANVVAAANAAFDGVGIGGSGQQNDYEQDASINPGSDLLLLSDSDQSNLYIKEIATGNYLANPLSQTNHISRPSVSDNGELVVFVSEENQIVLIQIDWVAQSISENVWDDRKIWRQAVISKDGRRVAALTSGAEPKIYVYDQGVGGDFVEFDLYNPTYSQGVSTGDVLYADAMEFDITGEFIVYDAINRISSSTSGEIEYWDIGFLNVWNNSEDSWALGNISKLFSGLDEGESVGNPTFSKNSPYILALDYLAEGEFKILGVNIEQSEIGEMFDNIQVSWPNYSRDDTKMVYDIPNFTGGSDIGDLDVAADKISTVVNSEGIEEADGRWGVWFSNGDRNLMVDVLEIEGDQNEIALFPNPASDHLNLTMDFEQDEKLRLQIVDLKGRVLMEHIKHAIPGENNWSIPIKDLAPANYVLKISWEDYFVVKNFIKL